MAEQLDGTITKARVMAEQSYDHTEGMTDEELVHLERLYRLSAPIKIPVHQLDPNYVYRWVNRNPKVFRRRLGIGWKPVTRKELEQLSKVPLDDLHMGTHTDESGYVALADDLIFCKMPKRVAEALRKARMRENRTRLSAGKRLFHETGELAGVPTYERD